MNIEIADYSVFFILPDLEEDTVQRIQQIAQETLGFEVSIGPRHLEFDYSGRDTGRKVVAFLCQAAPLIGSAEGEAECRLTTSMDDMHFEFYSVQHGCLYRQEAEIVKMPPSEVYLETPATELQLVAAG